MSKVNVIYWSQTGNTEIMAKEIAKGIESEGKQANVTEVNNVSPQDLDNETVFALGCPAMGDEVLEEIEMEPFVAAIESKVKGKNIALFGSYGWGDGEWMREWEQRMKDAGAVIVDDKGLVSHEEPDENVIAACNELGKKLAVMQV